MSCGGVKLVYRAEAFECVLVNAILVTELLQLAVRGTYAGQTLFVMCGKHKLKSRLSCFHDSCGIGTDIHALCYREYTGGNDTAVSLYNADTAGADLILFFHEAKSRNLHSRKTGSFKDGGIRRNTDRDTVNR